MLRKAEAADPDLMGLRAWLIAAAEDAGVTVHLRSPVAASPECDVLVWAVGTPWPDVDQLDGWLLEDGDVPSSPVTVRGSSKAALSIAVRARTDRADVSLDTDDAVLAPELGLPGRFRLVHDLRAAGVTIGPSTDPATVIHVRRAAPIAPPSHPTVHVIGDAAGTTGIAAALRAAADLARRL
jgi:hypothetical protein